MQADAGVPHNAITSSPGSQHGQVKAGRIFSSALLTLFVLAVATHSLVLSAAALGGAFFLVLRNLNALVAVAPRHRTMLLLAGALLTLTLPFALLRSETAFLHYFVSLLTMLTAYLLTRWRDNYFRASRLVLYGSLGCVAGYLMTTGVQGFPLENMIPDSSSNGITSYLIILQANFCVASYLIRRKIPVFTPLLTLAICVVGYGRGSILSAVMIIVINIIAFSVRNGGRNFLMATGLCAVLVMAYGDDITLFVEANTKIGSGLYDGSREAMIKEYGNLLERDEYKIITGADYKGTVIDSDYYGNPHNSYIRAHHIFGLPFLLLVLSFPFLASRGQGIAARVYPFALLAVMLFRAATEPILFPTMLDVFFFSTCFLMGMPKAPRIRTGVTYA